MTMRLGFIGTGTIAAAMVRGLKASALRNWPVVLSPRNAELAQTLASSLPGVTVAPDNQAVIDGSDMVVLAVRPQVVEAVLRAVRMRADQQVISLVAATSSAAISACSGATQVCRAIPLPFVEQRRDVTPVFPPHPGAMQLFNALGTALPVMDQQSFDLYGALSALMAQYFGMIEAAAGWAGKKGMPDADARAYLVGLYANLGAVLREGQGSLSDLRIDHSTSGGLNEQVHLDFMSNGGTAALTDALDAVLRRIKTAP
jgi:pyrroline-5-carboxylate reductase